MGWGVKAGAVARRNTNVRSRAFPINTTEKSPLVATITAIVNAWPPQCATCSLSAPEALLPVHSRFMCCLLASMAELEISRARPVPTKSLLIHKYSGRFHCGSGLLSRWTENRTLKLILITKCYAINAAMTNSQGQSPDGEGGGGGAGPPPDHITAREIKGPG